MVGFLRDRIIEEELYQQHSDDPLPIDFSVSELDDLSSSFADSLLDFDCIRDWIKETPVLDIVDLNTDSERVDSVKIMEVKSVEGCSGMGKDGSCRETGFEDGVQESGNLITSIEGNPFCRMVDLNPISEKVDSVSIKVNSFEGRRIENDGSCRETGFGDGVQKLGDLSSSIEEEVRKFTLDEGSEGNGSVSLKILGSDSSKSVDGVSVSEHGVNSGQKLMFHHDGLLKRGGAVGINQSGEMVIANGDEPKCDETRSDGNESDSKPDSDSSSYSSSSEEEKDDDDEEEEEEEEKKEEELKLEGEIDMEEGEIRDSEMEQNVVGSDDDEEDEDGVVAKGPVRSKNELQVLPPVPPVNVTLQPHHRTMPLGVILSIIGAQVIVEGIEKHNPLSEGSVLWITESRSPLGFIDEIFGPVKNPYYMIRYNSEKEIPSDIKNNTSISFVPEFANHILNDSSLYKKGYDASGEHDEEVTDEAEFSDDEKEAEHRRMLKMSKRGTNGPNLGNKKKETKFNNRGGARKMNSRPSTPRRPEAFHRPPINQNQQFIMNSRPSTPRRPEAFHQPPINQNQQFTLNSRASTPQRPDVFHQPPINQNQQFSSSSFGTCQGFAGNPRLVASFQAPGFLPPSSGVWTNGMPCEQQSMGFPFGVQTNGGMTWLQQNQQQQQSYQMPFTNGMPFQQQFNPGQMLHPNLGAQSNFSPGPAFAPWPGCLGQNGLNQPFGMGLQTQQAPMPINVGEQLRPPIPSNSQVPREFNQGVNRGHSRRPFHMGRGSFGGRGPRESK